MTANLCSRMKGIIRRIEFLIPPGIKPFDSSIVPVIKDRDSSLARAVTEGAKLCARDCEILESSDNSFHSEKDFVVSIGNFHETRQRIKREIHASCDGWLAYVGSEEWITSASLPIKEGDGDCNPFGAYSAACIVAGDAFKFLQGIDANHGTLADQVCFSAYSLETFDKESFRGALNPKLPEVIDLGIIHLVGCGAVGHSFCHSLLPLENVQGDLVLIDRKIGEFGKEEVLDYTNLNRYVLATLNDIGKPKAYAFGRNPSTSQK